MRRTLAAFAAAAALLGPAALTIASATAADATTTPLSVTLSAKGTGASAGWDTSGNLVLTPGSPASTTYAQMVVKNPAAAAPVNEPYFTTDHYAAGSPRWVIELSNKHSLWGYPPSSGLNGTDMAWTADNGNTYGSYVTAYGHADAGHASVTSAFIVADGSQASTHDTLKAVQYNGQTLSALNGVGPISNFYSHKCLDVRNGYYASNSSRLQQWTCGANGGANQRFRLALVGGTPVLQALAPAGQPQGSWCVTYGQVAGTSRLTLEDCTGSDQVISVTGSFYKFSDGNVMDDSGYSKVNGTYVIEHAQNTSGNATNQEWSLP